MHQIVKYVHLVPESALPDILVQPSRFVLVVEASASEHWRERVCGWMIERGCLYMMAWGPENDPWERAVDRANIEDFANCDIPKDKFIYTTSHDDEPLENVFWFSKEMASHPCVALERTIILHIALTSRKDALLRRYRRARWHRRQYART